MLRNGAEGRGRSIDGDEVAVRILPLQQWFTQHKQAAAAAVNPSAAAATKKQPGAGGGAAAAGEPWLAAAGAEGGGPEAVLAEVRRYLEAKPGLRVTGRVVAVLDPARRREQVVGILQAADYGGGSLCPGMTFLSWHPTAP